MEKLITLKNLVLFNELMKDNLDLNHLDIENELYAGEIWTPTLNVGADGYNDVVISSNGIVANDINTDSLEVRALVAGTGNGTLIVRNDGSPALFSWLDGTDLRTEYLTVYSNANFDNAFVDGTFKANQEAFVKHDLLAGEYLTPSETTDYHFKVFNGVTYIDDLVAEYSSLKKKNTIEVSSVAEFRQIAANVLNGTTYEGKTLIITKDLDLSQLESGQTQFDGLGTSSAPFMGSIDGQGHTITINQTYTGTQNDIGGLINFLAFPTGVSNPQTITIENLKVTGLIDITPSATDSADTHGGLITNTRFGATGDGACTLNIKNCISTVTISIRSNRVGQIGGFIAWIGHQDGYFAATTINFDNCIWGGYLNAGAATSDWGGFIGNTGLNKNNRNVTINFNNCIAAGKIALNVNWSDNAALFVGNQKSNYAGGTTTINVNNCLCSARFTSSVTIGSGKWIAYFNKQNDSHGVLNITNLYYYQHDAGGYSPIPITPSNAGAPATETNIVAKTYQEMKDLTYADWIKDENWVILKGLYYPCPKETFKVFATQSCLIPN